METTPSFALVGTVVVTVGVIDSPTCVPVDVSISPASSPFSAIAPDG